MSKTYLKELDWINYNGENFIIDKFSSFKEVYIDINIVNSIDYLLTYIFEANFSGSKLVIKKSAIIPCTIKTNKIGKFLGFIKYQESEYNPKWQFLKKNNGKLYQVFKESNWKDENKSFVISNYVKWIAENTDTKNVLEKLRENIKICFDCIDQYYQDKKNNKNTNNIEAEK